mmetsp:Transcript_95095/g.268619  ORF Transcript_95095/g.268619 Transcript_95095/m.268619 type:complete len:339 (+) Transcript_95095:1-1017(+)
MGSELGRAIKSRQVGNATRSRLNFRRDGIDRSAQPQTLKPNRRGADARVNRLGQLGKILERPGRNLSAKGHNVADEVTTLPKGVRLFVTRRWLHAQHRLGDGAKHVVGQQHMLAVRGKVHLRQGEIGRSAIEAVRVFLTVLLHEALGPVPSENPSLQTSSTSLSLQSSPPMGNTRTRTPGDEPKETASLVASRPTPWIAWTASSVRASAWRAKSLAMGSSGAGSGHEAKGAHTRGRHGTSLKSRRVRSIAKGVVCRSASAAAARRRSRLARTLPMMSLRNAIRIAAARLCECTPVNRSSSSWALRAPEMMDTIRSSFAPPLTFSMILSRAANELRTEA